MSQRAVCLATSEHGPESTCIRCDHEGPTAAGFDRAKAIARVTFLMPALTDAGLCALLGVAEDMAVIQPRDLRAGTLAAEQQARFADASVSAVRFLDAPRVASPAAATTPGTYVTVHMNDRGEYVDDDGNAQTADIGGPPSCPGCGMATYRDDGVAWCTDCEPRPAKPEGGPAVAGGAHGVTFGATTTFTASTCVCPVPRGG